MQRTHNQNNALHLYCKLLADGLNAGGFTVQTVLKENMDIDWNTKLVKELLWRPTQQVILGKDSTTELEKIQEIDVVFEHINRFVGERFGLHVPFPNDPDEAPLNK